jgi:hypothetical protein
MVAGSIIWAFALVQAANPTATLSPQPPTVAPDGLPIRLPIESNYCALSIYAVGDAPDRPPTQIKFFESGMIRIERHLGEAENKRPVADLILQLDGGWYAQGRPSLFRLAAPDNDPAKLSAPILDFGVESAFAQALGSSKSLTFWHDREKQENFDLTKIDRAQLDRWQNCIKDLPAILAARPVGAATYRRQEPLQPVTPINRGGWITSNDYPSRMMRMELQGTVAFTLAISINGMVRDCRMTEHNTTTIIPDVNNVPELNTETCRLLTRRARFGPATDNEGRPLLSYWSGRVRWLLPYD